MNNTGRFTKVLRALFNPASIEDPAYYEKRTNLQKEKQAINAERQLARNIQNRRRFTLRRFVKAVCLPEKVQQEIALLDKLAQEREQLKASNNKEEPALFTFIAAQKIPDSRTAWARSALQAQMQSRL